MASTKRSKKKQKSVNPLLRFTLSLSLVTLGSLILIFSSLKNIDWKIEPTHQIQISKKTPQKPSRIYIPQMNEILPVSDGYISGDHWVTSQIGVSYYTESALPGQGNTVIYGHNTAGILGGLWKVHEGDFIYLITNDGNYIKYQVDQRKEIEPTEVQILNQTEDSILTIYTCSGFLDSARFVLVAKKV